MTSSTNPLVLRNVKGSPRTFTEDDQNLQNLMRYATGWQSGDTYVVNQVVGHEGGAWVCVADSADEPGTNPAAWIPLGIVPGRGGMTKTPDTAGADITGTWQTMTYDTESVTSYGVLLNPAAGTLSSNWAGLWEIRFVFSMSHDDVNRGRSADIRLWNVDDGMQIGPTFYLAIGRNQPGTNAALFRNLELPQANVGKEIRLEIKADDPLSDVVWRTSTAELTQVSPPVV